ncbi:MULTISPECIES: hypothetical protein [unclassified Pseudomonas]|uniref:hypothetical protein n=1 Tax=unclassified Pseudomonas TaxID=196821 RepID=UPI001113FD3A|nr:MULTISPECIES: hypothetical protein [unclassified Pseudomonas]
MSEELRVRRHRALYSVLADNQRMLAERAGIKKLPDLVVFFDEMNLLDFPCFVVVRLVSRARLLFADNLEGRL